MKTLSKVIAITILASASTMAMAKSDGPQGSSGKSQPAACGLSLGGNGACSSRDDSRGRGRGHDSHGNGHGNGHSHHGNGHGNGHDDDDDDAPCSP